MLLSAAYQISHPLATKFSPTGTYSSRFVTCCLTGTEEGGIDVLAWQAAEQGEAMVKAGIVEATVDQGRGREFDMVDHTILLRCECESGRLTCRADALRKGCVRS